MKSRAFTLLEVMVAVAILGLALTVVLSAQTGLYSAGTHAQNEAMAIGLARCKMGEIEENLMRLGYPEIDSQDEGICCKDSTTENLRCAWKIQRVELPQPTSFSGDNVAGSAGLNLSNIPGTIGSATGMSSPTSMMGGMPALPNGAGALGALVGAMANDAGALQGDAGMQNLSQMMGSATAASGGISGLAPLVMSIVYPSLKPMLEASIRKIELTVKWTEGINSRELVLVQYVTNPMKGGISGVLPPGASADPTTPGMNGLGGTRGTVTGTSGTGIGAGLGGLFR
jgi:general secretion pathway protein I